MHWEMRIGLGLYQVSTFYRLVPDIVSSSHGDQVVVECQRQG